MIRLIRALHMNTYLSVRNIMADASRELEEPTLITSDLAELIALVKDNVMCRRFEYTGSIATLWKMFKTFTDMVMKQPSTKLETGGVLYNYMQNHNPWKAIPTSKNFEKSYNWFIDHEITPLLR